MGLAGYYKKFVKGFGAISKPLTALLKKGAMFVWAQPQEDSFQALKLALITTPVLALPDLGKTFVIEIDASERV